MNIEDIKFHRVELENGGYPLRHLQHQVQHCGGTCETCSAGCPGNCGEQRSDGTYEQQWRPGRRWPDIPVHMKVQRAKYKEWQMATGVIKKRVAGFGNDLGCFPRAKEVRDASR